MPGTVLGSVEAAVNKPTKSFLKDSTILEVESGTMGKAITELKYVNNVV